LLTHENYGKKHIDNSILAWFNIGLEREAIRLSKKRKRLYNHELLILNQCIDQDSEEQTTEMLDTLKSDSDTSHEAVTSVFIQNMLSSLTVQQRKVIKATVIERRTEKDTAEMLGMSQPAVHKMKERALKKLRLNFNPNKPIAKNII